MPKLIRENLEHPRDIAPAALQFLISDEFERIEGETTWKNERWIYAACKIPSLAGQIIRIDMRKL